jgi:hypothetical protein
LLPSLFYIILLKIGILFGFWLKLKKGGAMKSMKIFLVIIVAGMILACSSSQDKAYKSQEAVNKERLALIDKYKKCMKKADKNKEKEAQCEQYLKAADALK